MNTDLMGGFNACCRAARKRLENEMASPKIVCVGSDRTSIAIAKALVVLSVPVVSVPEKTAVRTISSINAPIGWAPNVRRAMPWYRQFEKKGRAARY